MSWHCLQELVEGYLEAKSSVGKRFALSKFTRTAAKSCLKGKETECCQCSQFGTTYDPSMVDRGMEKWISSQGASPASRSRSSANGKGKTTNETCGQKLYGSFVRYDLGSRSWKTSQGFLALGISIESSVTWPKAGIMRDGACWELPILERTIDVNDFGFWLGTPTAGTGTKGRSKKWRKGKTPNPQEFVQIWPTQTVRDSRSRGPSEATRDSPALNHIATQGRGGLLNPTWVEWLMGWPLGWTDLKPLETDNYRSAWLMPMRNYLLDLMSE